MQTTQTKTTLPALTVTQAAREAHVRRDRIWSLIADGTLEADTTTYPSRPIISRESFHRFFGVGPGVGQERDHPTDPAALRALVREVLADEVPVEVRRALAGLAAPQPVSP